MTPTAPKIHAYTSERTSTQQQRRGRLLRKRAPRPRLCASNRINGRQVPDCRAGLTLAGPLGTTMQQHGLAGLESSHCHWFPNLQREIARPQANQRVNVRASRKPRTLYGFRWTVFRCLLWRMAGQLFPIQFWFPSLQTLDREVLTYL